VRPGRDRLPGGEDRPRRATKVDGNLADIRDA
jgi:hypothetical protein